MSHPSCRRRSSAARSRVERPDRLGRPRHRRVVRRDHDLGEDGGDRRRRGPRPPARCGSTAAAGSRSRPASRRRRRRASGRTPGPRRAPTGCSDAPTCGPLPCVMTSAEAVADQADDRRGRPPRVRQLLRDRPLLAGADERVAADRDERRLRHEIPVHPRFDVVPRRRTPTPDLPDADISSPGAQALPHELEHDRLLRVQPVLGFLEDDRARRRR